MTTSVATMPTLESERLILSPLVAADAAAMFDGLCDPQLYRFIPDTRPESVQSLEKRYRRLERRISPDGSERWLNWKIQLKSTGQAAGFVQATVAAEFHAEIAYVLFSDFHRQGIAREATALMLEGLAAEGVTMFLARVNPGNERSQRLLDQLGFAVASSGTSPGTDLIYAADFESLRLTGRELPGCG